MRSSPRDLPSRRMSFASSPTARSPDSSRTRSLTAVWRMPNGGPGSESLPSWGWRGGSGGGPGGMPDPLTAIRTGERHPIRLDPQMDTAHGGEEVLSRCLAGSLVHARAEAPDLFARMENRTSGDGHGP